MLGSGLAQAVNLATVVVVARLYLPNDVGVLASFTAVAAITASFSTGRLELALPTITDTKAAMECFWAGVWLGVAAAVATAGVLGSVAVGGTAGSLPGWAVALLPVAILGASWYQMSQYYALRQQRFGAVALTSVDQSVRQSGIQIGVGLFQPTAWVLCVGKVAALYAGIVRLGPSISTLVSPRRAWSRARSLSRYPLYLAPAAMMNIAAHQLPILYLGLANGPAPAGQFAMASRLLDGPALVVAGAWSQSFLVHASRDPAESVRRLREQAPWVVPSLSLALAALWFGGPLIARGLLGERWGDAAAILGYLAPMVVTRMVAMPASQLLVVHQRQQWQLAWDVTRLATLTVLGLYAYGRGFDAVSLALAYSLTMTSFNIALVVMSITAANRRLPR